MKRTIGIILSLLIIMGAATVFGAEAAAVKVKNRTLRTYSGHSFTFKKSPSLKYYCKVKNNTKKFLSVKFKDNGTSYSVKTVAKKVTAKKRPVVTVYYKNASKKSVNVKRFRYKVKPMGTVKFKSLKMNAGVSEEVRLRNPFAYRYKIKSSDKDVADINIKTENSDDKDCYLSAKSLKEGSTTVSVYLKGVSEKVGEFKVTVGSYDTIINSKYKTLNLKYNSHGSSTYMEDSHINLKDALMYKHAGAKYSVEPVDEDVVSVVNGTLVYATGTGSTSATVYETIKKKSKAIGKIEIIAESAKMSYVAEQNALLYDGVIFGYGENVEFLDLTGTKTKPLKPTIVEKLINNSLTNSAFKSSEYKITFKSSNSKIAAVSSAGKVTAVKAGTANITYTIVFKDKSVYKNICKITVE
ncbi:MAG: Ig-like domain-containing protein [Ruminococcus sp.]|nr:Ig-like domain-containing protein [Ruminococcus sp.]